MGQPSLSAKGHRQFRQPIRDLLYGDRLQLDESVARGNRRAERAFFFQDVVEIVTVAGFVDGGQIDFRQELPPAPAP